MARNREMTEKTFRETLYTGWQTEYKSTEVYFDSATDHQRLVIFRNPTFGRMMMLDGVTQTTEADEFIYHEMLAHVPIIAHGAATRILIIGGGDGGMLREVLRHASVKHCTMVEIDPGVVELSKLHLPNHARGAFDDPRTNLVFADGAAYVKDTDDTFDVIIVDSTDPIGPGEVLFQDTFYANAKKCLTPGGVLVTQNGVPFMQPDELKHTVTHLRHLFNDASCYMATIPTYVGGPMAFGWASDNAELRQVELAVLVERFAKAGITTRYYTPAVHKGAFALPVYVSEIID
ncbi:polyamine aminopropyltransferase [Thalassospiraceae bacterium LMO-JJ14]|nr:polyamine aminopropyltransferase [Thalassospiraceae bacterium LMO-JJ14]